MLDLKKLAAKTKFDLAISKRGFAVTWDLSAKVADLKLNFQPERFNQTGCTGCAVHRPLKA
jgi:hypothetical protein